MTSAVCYQVQLLVEAAVLDCWRSRVLLALRGIGEMEDRVGAPVP